MLEEIFNEPTVVNLTVDTPLNLVWKEKKVS